jgi:hypothetical protein
MPAPTALVQPIAAPEAALPALEQEDELLVDMQEANTAEPSAAAPPTAADDTDMAIDEEGRPRFAPGKDIVCRDRSLPNSTCWLTACPPRRTLSAAPRRERSLSRQTACLP